MDSRCPRCGGLDIRQITPGFFECTSQVVGIMHQPGGDSRPVGYPCGHRFQVGVAMPTELCGCGRQSIGRCVDCGKPLCGLCGTAGGPFLCATCVRARADRRRREETEAAERRAAESATNLAQVEQRRAAALDRLRSARTPADLVDLIIELAADIPGDVAKEYWLSLVKQRAIQPTCDLVEARGRRHILYESPDPGTNWREVGRLGLWAATGLPSDDKPIDDRWVDSHGGLWSAATSQDLRVYSGHTPQTYPFMPGARGDSNWIALPKGAAFRTKIRPPGPESTGTRSPWSYVDGGVRLERLDADNFSLIAAAALRGV
jgi:hypothetical protein